MTSTSKKASKRAGLLGLETAAACDLDDTGISWLTDTFQLPKVFDPGQIAEAVKTRLRRAVVWFKIDSAAVLHYIEAKRTWRPIIHAFRIVDHNSPKKSADSIRFVARDPKAIQYLNHALQDAIASGPLELKNNGTSVENIGIARLEDDTCVVIGLNRHVSSSEEPWTSALLADLRRVMTDLPNSVLQLSQETYEADLPELVKNHVGFWVVYHGAHRYGVFETELDALDSCESEGVPFTERFVRQIVIDPPLGNRLIQESWTRR